MRRIFVLKASLELISIESMIKWRTKNVQVPNQTFLTLDPTRPTLDGNFCDPIRPDSTRPDPSPTVLRGLSDSDVNETQEPGQKQGL